MIRHLPLFLSGMTKGRSFPTIAPQPTATTIMLTYRYIGVSDITTAYTGNCQY